LDGQEHRRRDGRLPQRTQGNGQPREIVVVRALRGVGDVLCAVPALRHIRSTMPDAHVRFIGVSEVESLVKRYPSYVDEFVPFPGHPGIPESDNGEDGHSNSEALAHCENADLVVQAHGDGSISNRFAASLHPHAIAARGIVVTDDGCKVITRPYERDAHEIERCLHATDDGLRLLGSCPAPPSTATEFPIDAAEYRQADELLAHHRIADGPFVIMHPGSHLADRRWPAEHFSALGERLTRGRLGNGDGGAWVLITGTEEESRLTRNIAEMIGPAAIDVSGKLTLGALAALLERSKGLVTNDTGISHLAAATKTRSVVLFMASDPHRWAPLDSTLHRAVVRPAGQGTTPNATTPEGRGLAIPSVTEAYSAARAVGIA
jgi:ADP-heptose:LPS heptosyltransferase